jgi:hypothetical protein
VCVGVCGCRCGCVGVCAGVCVCVCVRVRHCHRRKFWQGILERVAAALSPQMRSSDFALSLLILDIEWIGDVVKHRMSCFGSSPGYMVADCWF